MSEYFNADKGSRNAAFSVEPGFEGEGVAAPYGAGDGGLEAAAKVDGDTGAPDLLAGTGGSHVHPVDLSACNKVMPGEQEDPRLC